MSTRLKDATDEQLKEDFEDKVEPMIDYIRKHWNWESMVPKDYEKYRKLNELEHDELSQACHEQLTLHLDDYKGLDDNDSMGTGFINTLLPYHVAFQHMDQGRDPLTSIVHALIGWGTAYHKEYNKRFGTKTQHQKKCREEVIIEILQYVLKSSASDVEKKKLLEMVSVLNYDFSFDGMNAKEFLKLSKSGLFDD
jgi:hypothetical protein